jgi:hypothetical protein
VIGLPVLINGCRLYRFYEAASHTLGGLVAPAVLWYQCALTTVGLLRDSPRAAPHDRQVQESRARHC